MEKMYATGYMRIKSILSKEEIYCRIILNKWYILIKIWLGKNKRYWSTYNWFSLD